MLGFSKKVLKGVSFDRNLFQKELKKSIENVKKEDVRKLYIWCLASFAMYNDLIIDVFDSVK